MEIALYARVSTQRQQQDQTIEQQLEQLHAFLAHTPEWQLAPENIFLDDGYSGAKMARPGLDRLRERARLAAFSLVLLTAPDRLMRDYTQQILLLDELTRLGCRVAFPDRPASLHASAQSNDGPHEQLVLQIRGAVAEYERTLIGERMRRGRRARLRSGQLLPWTRPPYGYLLDAERPRDPARVQTDPVKAVVVAQIFDWYTQSAPRLSLYQVAQRLNLTQIPTASGRARWQPATICGILRNPAYSGMAYSDRTHNCPAQSRQSALRPVGAGQSSSPAPPTDWISVTVPALISAETFALAQTRLAENKQMAPRHNTKHEYLLRGLVSCGRCQLACSARWAAPHHPYYACYGRYDAYRTATAERCHARYAPAVALDQLVWQDLCQLLSEPARITRAFDRAQAGEGLPQALQARRATLARTLQQLEKQQTNLLDLYLAEVIQRAEFERKRQELAQTQGGLSRQLKELEVQAQKQLDLALLAAGVDDFCQRLRPTLNQLSFAQRRQLVELLVDRVIVNDGQVEVRYVIPTGPAGEKKRFCHLRKDYFATAPRTASLK